LNTLLAHAIPLVTAAGLVASCGGDPGPAQLLRPTQKALERGVHGTCRAVGDDGRRWRCRLEEPGSPAVTVRVDDRGAWHGELRRTNPPPRTVTVTVDGQEEVATMGDFTRGRSVFGCCVPLP